MNYAARVSLDRTQMQVEDKLVNLSPGMAVTVEIKTGSRRIISYLLSPVSDISRRPAGKIGRVGKSNRIFGWHVR